MLHRIIDSILHIGHDSGFEDYLSQIQRSGRPGTPTAHEARRDYRNIPRSDNSLLIQ